MLDPWLRRHIDGPLGTLGAAVAAQGISATTVTLVGFGLGVLAMVAIAFEAYGSGLVLLLANRLADGLDGAVARAAASQGRPGGESDLGAYLDIVLDFLVYSGVVFAFALADPERALAAAFLIYSYIGTGSSFLAYAIIAAKRQVALDERRGRKGFFYAAGLAEGTETIVATVLMCLLPQHFGPIALGFGVLCWITTAARILEATRAFGVSPRR